MYIISVSILVIVSILNCFRHKYDRSTSQCPEFFILNFAGFLLFGPTVCVLSVSRENQKKQANNNNLKKNKNYMLRRCLTSKPRSLVGEIVQTRVLSLTLVQTVSVMKWGPSRACVQAGPALYHVINKNTRT